MNQQLPPEGPEEIQEIDEMVVHLLESARAFPYPPTPDIAGSLRPKRNPVSHPTRRLAWAAVILLILACALLSVPEVRAAIAQILHLGSVTIFTTPPTETATPQNTSIPIPTVTPIPSLLDLAGETTLADAKTKIKFPIRLPGYPSDLGLPDRVFVQSLDGPVVVLVWLDPQRGIKLSLHLLGNGAIVFKMLPKIIKETMVHGQRAVWTEGPYLIEIIRATNNDWDMRRLIDGHVLIWMEGEITYRLETDATLEEAVKIAESIR